MILQDVQDFIHNGHLVSLAEMEQHFHIEGQALQAMIHKLIRKGRVRQAPVPTKCHGCTFCDGHALTFYEWVDEQNRPEPHHGSRCSIPCCQDQPIHSLESKLFNQYGSTSKKVG